MPFWYQLERAIRKCVSPCQFPPVTPQVLPERSQISVGKDIGKWGTALGIGATGVVPGLAVLGGTRAMLNEGMRKFLTGAPLGEFKLPARIARMMRQAGVSSIDQIEDPVFKQQVIKEAEAEMQPE